ncbi:MAG: acetyltransferase [Methanobrevibacter sp.]|nr:acetyltransferase [Methanobrevibacter sp.]
MYLYGASGHAKVICDIIEAMGEKVHGFFDDNENIVEFKGKPVEHTFSNQAPLIICIGNNFIRKKIAVAHSVEYATAVHPSSIISRFATIGKGTVVMQGCIIQTDTNIGRHCIINTGSSIDHECIIDDYVHISPHSTLCGNVHVGEGSWIGAGSTIIQGVNIGRWCVIGAGSVVTKNIPDGYMAVGNRCKLIKLINKDLL